MHFVIVGGGIAGVSALEHLCHLATSSTHTPEATHSAAAYAAAHDEDDVSITFITPTSVLKHITNVKQLSNNRSTFDIESTPHATLLSSLPAPHPPIAIHLATLVRLDPPTHTLSLKPTSDAPVPATVTYDRLLLAVGASPTVPFCGRAVHVLRDLETVDEVQAAIASLPEPTSAPSGEADVIMVVGNGGIALELIHALTSSQRHRQLVWVVKDAHMGNTFLDREASAFLLPLLFPAEDPTIDDKRFGDEEEQRARTGGMRDPIAGTGIRAGRDERVYGGGVGPFWQTRLNQHFSSTASAASSSIHAPANLTIHFNTIVTSTSHLPASTSSTASLSANLSNGLTYHVALLLSATGVWPNTAFLASSIALNSALVLDLSDGGIVTDASTLQTSAADVWAAGDCTHMQWHSKDDSEMLQKRTWSQARTAGLNAAVSLWHNRRSETGEADGDVVWYPLFTHTTQLFGQKVVLLGLYNESEYYKRRPDGSQCTVCMKVTPVGVDGTGGEYVKCVMECGRAVGCTLIGDTELEDMMENLIVNRTDMSVYDDDWLRADVDLNDYFD